MLTDYMFAFLSLLIIIQVYINYYQIYTYTIYNNIINFKIISKYMLYIVIKIKLILNSFYSSNFLFYYNNKKRRNFHMYMKVEKMKMYI